MKKWLIVAMCLLLTGCWDRQSLKALHMVDIIGIDQEKDAGNIHLNYVVSSLADAFQGGGKPDAHLYEAENENLFGAAALVERQMPGAASLANNRIYLLNREFARHNPGTNLDFIGKIPASPMLARVGIVDGSVGSLLKLEKIQGTTIPNILVSMLNQAEQRNSLVGIRLWELILSKRNDFKDIAVPLIGLTKDNKIEIKGLSLFSDGSYSGIDLSPPQSVMLMTIDRYKKNQLLYINGENETFIVKVDKVKRSFSVIPGPDGIQKIIIPVRMEVQHISRGKMERPINQKDLAKFEKAMSEIMSVNAKKMIRLLQQAKCDYLGIGRYIYANKPDLWMNMNWHETYPKLQIEPEFKVNIINSGIYDYQVEKE
ncbi:Ger(x)C family spore germination protein [Paenibacillus sp. LHD-117]|uniref:Ger(x)C family spore germination protein n=1 Tax=Paenibacillus sp. LHD-117 TaxID=3071412 RepID=UPI0027DFA10A|nr:Ger(x)C family spore germination protein [Paenibacillus sp. LHD-117]MDQ6420636.1 Ger(x)C family spore germination protein [Paenibacillus sp. LHD-117]